MCIKYLLSYKLDFVVFHLYSDQIICSLEIFRKENDLENVSKII